MDFNQFGVASSIVSGVENVDVCIMSILHSHVIHRNEYILYVMPTRINHTYQNDCKEVMEIFQPITGIIAWV